MSRKTKALEFANEQYDILVTGRNVLVTDSMKDYAMEKISKIERFSDRILDVNVIMDIQKLEHRVDIIIKIGHIKIKSSAASEDMYISIDKAVHRIKEQLRRYKTKIQDHQARGAKAVDMSVTVFRRPLEEDLVDFNDEIEQENVRHMENGLKPHEIVKKETRPLKMLSYEEAIMKMELSGDSFMIFRNESDKKIKIIYRREDENFGIIEPE